MLLDDTTKDLKLGQVLAAHEVVRPAGMDGLRSTKYFCVISPSSLDMWSFIPALELIPSTGRTPKADSQSKPSTEGEVSYETDVPWSFSLPAASGQENRVIAAPVGQKSWVNYKFSRPAGSFETQPAELDRCALINLHCTIG